VKRALPAIVGAVVFALLVFAFVRLTATPRPEHGLSTLDVGPDVKVRLSPSGARVALVEGGAISVATVGDGKVVMRRAGNIVDAAWMPDGRRALVVEGPIPTGEVSTIDVHGKVDGAATLNPSIGFGNGEGVSIDRGGTRAAVIAVTRDDVTGVSHRDLAVVELATGAVRVYPTARDESAPLFLERDLVAVASQGKKGPARLDLVDLTNGTVDAGRPIIAGPYARTFAGEAVVARRAAQGAYRLIAISPVNGRERTLHVTRPHRHVLAVDASVTGCVVRVLGEGGVAHLAIETFD
jgi:hypothetical protein